MDDSSVNFHDVFFFIFCQIIAKNEETTSWKFTDESSITFQSCVSGPGEFVHNIISIANLYCLAGETNYGQLCSRQSSCQNPSEYNTHHMRASLSGHSVRVSSELFT